MLYAVLFTDDDTRAAVRAEKMPEHLAFLEHHKDAVRAAGPLREAVTALVHADPFWPTGLRQSVRVLEWRRVFADGARLI